MGCARLIGVQISSNERPYGMPWCRFVVLFRRLRKLAYTRTTVRFCLLAPCSRPQECTEGATVGIIENSLVMAQRTRCETVRQFFPVPENIKEVRMKSSRGVADVALALRSWCVSARGAWLFFALASPLLFSHCASKDQVSMLERRVYGLATENQSLRKTLQNTQQEMTVLQEAVQKTGREDIASVRSRQADVASQIEELRAELLRLNGLIEQMDYRSRTEQEEAVRFRQEIAGRMDQLGQDLKLLQASAEAAKEVEQARQKAASGEVDLYQQALDSFKKQEFKEAKKTLETYVEKHPQGDRVANAYFWMGECEYNIQRYEEAILEYQQVISKFSDSNKVPDALLKQGISFARLGDNESAKIVLNKLLNKYPKSPQASVATKQLARLR
jgi:tol-pal system protein YbgF